MDGSHRFIAEYFGENKPLSDSEIDELAVAVRGLAFEGIPVPKQLLRNEYTGDLRTSRAYGHTLNAIPIALERLGPEREMVVVALISRLEKAIKDVRDNASRKLYERDKKIGQRYFDIVFLVAAAKPKTEESVTLVADFLRSDKSEVHEKASEMLEGATYFPVIVDRLFENVAAFGIQRWPNRQARALASFTHIPEVRVRLMSCFQSDQKSLRYMAVMAVARLKENADSDVERELFAIAENDEDELQGAALDSLNSIIPKSAQLRELALRLIHSEKYWVRGNAIWCLGEFPDPESIDALMTALLDEGGHDFDNAGSAAKILEKMPLDAGRVLAPLMNTLKQVMEREDEAYQKNIGFRGEFEHLAKNLAERAQTQGKSGDTPRSWSYASPETLLAVVRVIGSLGVAALPAVPLIEESMGRPYIARASDGEEWRTILAKIRGTESTSTQPESEN